MPVSAFGEFTARSADESGFVRSQAATFTYYPTFFIPWSVGGLGLVFFAWLTWKLRRFLVGARFAVLFPGVAGIAVTLLSGMEEYITFLVAFPLETVSVTFLLWRLVRVRNRFLAAALALAHGIGVIAVNLFFVFGETDLSQFIDNFGAEGLVLGVLIAAPIVGPRLLLKGRVTRRRFILGLGLGFLMELAALGVGIAMWGNPGGGAWMGLFLFVPGAVLFTVLVKWNRWARAVATGEMFRRDQPGTVPPSS